MTLRFMQVFIPKDVPVKLEALLEGHEILGTWADATLKNRVVIHLLVPADQTEPIMDKLEHAYEDVKGFQVVLTPVEAVLPRPKEIEQGAGKDPGASTGEKIKNNVEKTDRISREELYSDISESLDFTRMFAAMTIFSSVVAAVGLLRDDTAVIIGAMVIAPFLGPNIGLSLATTLGDLTLLWRAAVTNFLGILLAMVIAVALGAALNVDPTIPAIAARTQFTVADLALAIAAGSAGTMAFTAGLAGPVIGVMVAVALVPPLVTFGMLLGSGQPVAALGALLLVIANIICINLAGVATFLLQGVRPRRGTEKGRARNATVVAASIWCVILAGLLAILLIAQPEWLG